MSRELYSYSNLNKEYLLKLTGLVDILDNLIELVNGEKKILKTENADIEEYLENLTTFDSAEEKASLKDYGFNTSYICDEYGKPPPKNIDVDLKHSFGIVTCNEANQLRWVPDDMDALITLIRKEVIRIKCEPLMKKRLKLLTDLELDNPDAIVTDEKYKDHQTRLETIERSLIEMQEAPITIEEIKAVSSDDINWNELCALLGKTYTARQCEQFWRNYIHPSVNKSAWTDEENKQLRNLVDHVIQNKHDWSRVARDLGTNRLPYQCLAQYQKLFRDLKPWTTEEDSRLITLVEEHRVGNRILWSLIFKHFPERSSIQLVQRYKKINPNLRTGKWDLNEMHALKKGIEKYGFAWTKIASLIPGRTDYQCREKYIVMLEPGLKFGEWSALNDAELLAHLKREGFKWSHIARLIPTRNDNQVRNRALLLFGIRTSPSEQLMEEKMLQLESELNVSYLRYAKIHRRIIRNRKKMQQRALNYFNNIKAIAENSSKKNDKNDITKLKQKDENGQDSNQNQENEPLHSDDMIDLEKITAKNELEKPTLKQPENNDEFFPIDSPLSSITDSEDDNYNGNTIGEIEKTAKTISNSPVKKTSQNIDNNHSNTTVITDDHLNNATTECDDKILKGENDKPLDISHLEFSYHEDEQESNIENENDSDLQILQNEINETHNNHINMDGNSNPLNIVENSVHNSFTNSSDSNESCSETKSVGIAVKKSRKRKKYQESEILANELKYNLRCPRLQFAELDFSGEKLDFATTPLDVTAFLLNKLRDRDRSRFRTRLVQHAFVPHVRSKKRGSQHLPQVTYYLKPGDTKLIDFFMNRIFPYVYKKDVFTPQGIDPTTMTQLEMSKTRQTKTEDLVDDTVRNHVVVPIKRSILHNMVTYVGIETLTRFPNQTYYRLKEETFCDNENKKANLKDPSTFFTTNINNSPYVNKIDNQNTNISGINPHNITKLSVETANEQFEGLRNFLAPGIETVRGLANVIYLHNLWRDTVVKKLTTEFYSRNIDLKLNHHNVNPLESVFTQIPKEIVEKYFIQNTCKNSTLSSTSSFGSKRRNGNHHSPTNSIIKELDLSTQATINLIRSHTQSYQHLDTEDRSFTLKKSKYGGINLPKMKQYRKPIGLITPQDDGGENTAVITVFQSNHDTNGKGDKIKESQKPISPKTCQDKSTVVSEETPIINGENHHSDVEMNTTLAGIRPKKHGKRSKKFLSKVITTAKPDSSSLLSPTTEKTQTETEQFYLDETTKVEVKPLRLLDNSRQAQGVREKIIPHLPSNAIIRESFKVKINLPTPKANNDATRKTKTQSDAPNPSTTITNTTIKNIATTNTNTSVNMSMSSTTLLSKVKSEQSFNNSLQNDMTAPNQTNNLSQEEVIKNMHDGLFDNNSTAVQLSKECNNISVNNNDINQNLNDKNDKNKYQNVIDLVAQNHDQLEYYMYSKTTNLTSEIMRLRAKKRFEDQLNGKKENDQTDTTNDPSKSTQPTQPQQPYVKFYKAPRGRPRTIKKPKKVAKDEDIVYSNISGQPFHHAFIEQSSNTHYANKLNSELSVNNSNSSTEQKSQSLLLNINNFTNDINNITTNNMNQNPQNHLMSFETKTLEINSTPIDDPAIVNIVNIDDINDKNSQNFSLFETKTTDSNFDHNNEINNFQTPCNSQTQNLISSQNNTGSTNIETFGKINNNSPSISVGGTVSGPRTPMIIHRNQISSSLVEDPLHSISVPSIENTLPEAVFNQNPLLNKNHIEYPSALAKSTQEYQILKSLLRSLFTYPMLLSQQNLPLNEDEIEEQG